MKKIKVLHVINGMGTGGAEKDIMNWYRNIDREKFQFDFLIRSDQEFYKAEIEQLGGKLYRVSNFPAHALKNFRETRNFFNEHGDYDVVHVHGNALVYVYPLIAANKKGITTRIFHTHNTKANGFLAQILHCINKNIVYKYANYLIACSVKAGEFSYGKHEFKVINNAIDVEKYHGENAYDKKELGLEGNFIVGHIGRFLPVKNQKFVIDVFKRIHNRRKEARLLLVGEGPLKKKLEQYVISLGINDDVLFLGERNDVEKIIPLMDIMIFPSLYEGVPLVPLEAQASGTKIICSDIVDNQIILTPYIKKLPLADGADKWAEFALVFSEEIIKCNIIECFEKKGYTLEGVIRQITGVYENGSKQ